MSNQVLVIVKGENHHRVALANYQIVIESNISCLLNKTPADVWRWARAHKAKVYFEEFQPKRYNNVISHAYSFHRGCQL